MFGNTTIKFSETDISRIVKCRKIGMSWKSIAKAYEMPISVFKRAVERTKIRQTLNQLELDLFCEYESLTVSGEMPANYKIHLDKTRFKNFNEQEDKMPQVDITFTQEIADARKDIEQALEESSKLKESDISDFVADTSTLGKTK